MRCAQRDAGDKLAAFNVLHTLPGYSNYLHQSQKMQWSVADPEIDGTDGFFVAVFQRSALH